MTPAELQDLADTTQSKYPEVKDIPKGSLRLIATAIACQDVDVPRNYRIAILERAALMGWTF
jgi:hypothetical protein